MFSVLTEFLISFDSNPKTLLDYRRARTIKYPLTLSRTLFCCEHFLSLRLNEMEAASAEKEEQWRTEWILLSLNREFYVEENRL